ncbi:MAG TPA: TIGR01777 family oxidoreductase [Longilinea sp.]|nr:TIGR01777 family oxidoreductase [Longilinea sp.]
MRIVITGGTGLIGNALASDFAKNGYEVYVLSRSPAARKHLQNGIECLQYDGHTAAGWGYLVEGADAVINLAGENLSAGRWTEKRKHAILQSRLDAGRAVAQAIEQAKQKPPVLIQASAVGCYGINPPGVVDETSPFGNDFLSGVCRQWEESTKAVEIMGVRRVIIRMGVVFSGRGGAFPRLILPFKLFAGGALGNGEQWLSWVHLQDVVRAIRFLIEQPATTGVFNVSAEPVTNREFAQIAGRVMHRPSFFKVPAFAIKMLFGEMSTVILDGQRVSSAKLRNLGFSFAHPGIENALQDLVRKQNNDGH